MSNLPLEIVEMFGQTIARVVPITIVLALVFSVLSYFWACNPGAPWWRKREIVTDVCYWFFVPLITRVVRIGLLVLGAATRISALLLLIMTVLLQVFFAPEALWMLPGLWQLLVGLGIFASVRSLPRTVAFAGAWYFVVGFTVLLLASQSHALSPWTMGLPFVAGQLLMAALLHFASGETDVED